MKIRTSKVLIACLAVITTIFSSCVDESIQLDNLSTDIKVGGNLAIPIGEATISIQNLLDEMEVDSLDIEGFSIGDESGILTVYFSDTLEYDNPANIDLSEFGTIDQTIKFGGLTGFAPDSTTPFVIPTGINLRLPVVRGYNFNDVNDDPSTQRLDSVVFKNTNINVTVLSSISFPANYASLDIQLPAEFVGLDTAEVIKMPLVGTTSTKDFEYKDFAVNAIGKDTSDFDIDLVITGNDGVTIDPNDQIQILMTLSNTSFVAYGYFNLGEDVLQEQEDLAMDIYSFLPEGSMIKPHNPEIKFTLNSNVGVPLLFNVKQLKAFDTSTPSDTVSATWDGNYTKQFDIHPASSYGQTDSTQIVFNREDSNGKLSELFTIKPDSISTGFSFGMKDNGTGAGGQFVSSDSKMSIVMDTKMPIWLDAGSIISFTDTMEMDGNDLAKILSDDKIKQVCLYIKATNKLPLGLSIDLDLLDKDSLDISTSPYLYELKAGKVDANGAVTTATESTIEINFSKTNFEDLLKTKYIKFVVSAQAYDINSSMKFRTSDWLKIKLSAYGIGEYVPEME